MRDGYVYYAQSIEHPGDPMYAMVGLGWSEIDEKLKGREDDYFVFRFDTHGACKVVSGVQDT